ncbi:MAG: AraC family transcriptional regulator [Lentisphaerae bacterium]|jgi:AraC-like DNA-binding protein|nr:AraC family transcriptional regulator [Lentisphaerota bacterium]
MFFTAKYRYNVSFPHEKPKAVLIHSPLHVRSCGHYRTAKGWRDAAVAKNFLQLYWGVAGSGLFRAEEKEFILKPNTVFFFLPGDVHDITALEDGFEYQWIAFDGDNLDNTIAQFHIKHEVRYAGKAPLEIFEDARNNLCNFSQRGEYLAAANGFTLLSMAFAGTTLQGSVFERFLGYVRKNYSNPNLTMEAVAHALKINRITLLRAVLKESGMSPKKYLDMLRMREALSLLRESSFSIKEIAASIGFSNSNYFAKVILKKTGKPPSFHRTNRG